MATDILERPIPPLTSNDNQVLVTLTVGDQLCGVPVLAVRDILGEQDHHAYPSRTARDCRQPQSARPHRHRDRPAPPPAPAAAPPGQARMSVVAEQGGELYALLVDQVSEVLSLDAIDVRAEPADAGKILGRVQQRHLPPGRAFAGGAGRLQAACTCQARNKSA